MSSSTSSLSILTTLPRDDVAVVELHDRRVDRVGKRLTAEVVEYDEAVRLCVTRGLRARVVRGGGGLTRGGGCNALRGRRVSRFPALLGDGDLRGLRRVLLRQLCSSTNGCLCKRPARCRAR